MPTSKRESVLGSFLSLTVNAQSSLASILSPSAASASSAGSPRRGGGSSSGGGGDRNSVVEYGDEDPEPEFYAEDLLPEDLWERILLCAAKSIKDLGRLSRLSRSIRKQTWTGNYSYMLKAAIVVDHYNRLLSHRRMLASRRVSLYMSLMNRLSTSIPPSEMHIGETALPRPVFFLPDATPLITSVIQAGIISPETHPSALRFAVESGNMDLLRTLILQLNYVASPDLVPLCLRTCGPPRIHREALLLLLASMVNADDSIDATAFNTHIVTNKEVEKAFVQGMGIAPTWVRKGYLRDRFAPTLVAMAAHENQVNVVRLLARRGCPLDDVPAGNFHGWGPLSVACARGNVNIVNFLLSAAASAVSNSSSSAIIQLDRPDLLAGFTPLHLAAAFGHLDCVVALLVHGLPPDSPRRPRPANVAITSEADVEIRRAIAALDLPTWFLQPKDLGKDSQPTPLWDAAMRNQPHIVPALVANGASLDILSRSGKSILYLAVAELGYVSELSRAKAAAAATGAGAESTTATMATAVQPVPTLNSSAALPEREGFTALHRAAQLGNVGAVALLAPLFASVGAVDARDGLGCSPLHAACARSRLLPKVEPVGLAAVVETLIEYGADVTAVDGMGRTPLDVVEIDEVRAVLEKAAAAVAAAADKGAKEG
ncbi:ankyrin repeat-containing domain protein [Zopfochytrium polystomum]|nr:ankyrin repeat-containing domain protein [Zopfochytrium polystomum]